MAAAVWQLDPEIVRPWRCPEGDKCTPGHDLASPMPGWQVARTASERSSLHDGRFDRCPAHGIRAARGLLDLWGISNGKASELRAILPSPSAAMIDAWGVMTREFGALHDEMIRRKDAS